MMKVAGVTGWTPIRSLSPILGRRLMPLAKQVQSQELFQFPDRTYPKRLWGTRFGQIPDRADNQPSGVPISVTAPVVGQHKLLLHPELQPLHHVERGLFPSQFITLHPMSLPPWSAVMGPYPRIDRRRSTALMTKYILPLAMAVMSFPARDLAVPSA